MDFSFLVNSILLGVGLAMDAFSVSVANAMHDPRMGRAKGLGIAGTFAFFQFLMPMIGWFCVHKVVEVFRAVEPLIPWIAFLLLLYIGGKMFVEGIRGEEEDAVPVLGAATLIMQGVATSLDALSVGFTIAEYNGAMAFAASLIIAVVTLFICLGGLQVGKRFGMRLAGKASCLGGVILIAIGMEILIKHLGA